MHIDWRESWLYQVGYAHGYAIGRAEAEIKDRKVTRADIAERMLKYSSAMFWEISLATGLPKKKVRMIREKILIDALRQHYTCEY